MTRSNLIAKNQNTMGLELMGLKSTFMKAIYRLHRLS